MEFLTNLWTSISHMLSPQGWVALIVGWFFFSNIVSAMPSPCSDAGNFRCTAWYKFLYVLCHGLSANVGRILAAFLPQAVKDVLPWMFPPQPKEEVVNVPASK